MMDLGTMEHGRSHKGEYLEKNWLCAGIKHEVHAIEVKARVGGLTWQEGYRDVKKQIKQKQLGAQPLPNKPDGQSLGNTAPSMRLWRQPGQCLLEYCARIGDGESLAMAMPYEHQG